MPVTTSPWIEHRPSCSSLGLRLRIVERSCPIDRRHVFGNHWIPYRGRETWLSLYDASTHRHQPCQQVNFHHCHVNDPQRLVPTTDETKIDVLAHGQHHPARAGRASCRGRGADAVPRVLLVNPFYRVRGVEEAFLGACIRCKLNVIAVGCVGDTRGSASLTWINSFVSRHRLLELSISLSRSAHSDLPDYSKVSRGAVL
jgi:hypothetical protein